ncbi:hypothetical protein BD413DRAFT_582539 [Trametes elegans]|nr:hypothetical protein BD413DRAFT_582539 [Trametes elegans]
MAKVFLPNLGSHMTPERERGTHNVHPRPSAQLPPSAPSSSSSDSMPASASSSRASGSRPPRRKTDAFKPRFPLDPFVGASASAPGEPWFLKVDALFAATACQRPNVIFVLGGASHIPFASLRCAHSPSAPSLKELAPLLQSRHLANSLVILATHNPPDIPQIVLPTVRILHLSAPLALEDAGAIRFVNVLEWAERVARTWRRHGGTGVLQLSEEVDIHSELVPPTALRTNGLQSMPSSPGSSTSRLSTESTLPSRPSSFFRPQSPASSTFLPRLRQGSHSLPQPDPSQRPFDVLINFLPDHVSDKAMLKNSILVTTISRPFLVSNCPAPPAARSRTASSSSTSRFNRSQSFFRSFSRSSSSVYLPPTPPYQSGESLTLTQLPPPPPMKALLIHLLPASPAGVPSSARRKLVQSMESFLVSFALQAVTPSSIGGEMLERARPYVMEATTFGDAVGCEPGVADWGDWTVADVVLSGTLDADATPSPAGIKAGVGMAASPGTGKGRAIPKSKTSRRAWIAAAADLIILPSPDESSTLSPEAGFGHGSRPRPDSYFVQKPPRAFVKDGRSTSAPLLSSDTSPGRPHSHPQTPHSISSALSRQLSPNSGYSRTTPDAGAPSSYGSVLSGLPTPPHSEESDGGSVDAPSSPRGPRSIGSLSGSGKSERSSKKFGWKFWRRLSHMPAPIQA